MINDFDYDLSTDQWEALKALRSPARDRVLKTYRVEELVRLGLVEIQDNTPAITEAGRKVLVRGSCRLLDVAA